MPADGRRLGARGIAVLAVCAALVFALQVALAGIPNGECVTLLFLLYTLYFRRRTLYIIYTFALLEGVTYGFGIWWFMYLYVWIILWAVVMLLGGGSAAPCSGLSRPPFSGCASGCCARRPIFSSAAGRWHSPGG